MLGSLQMPTDLSKVFPSLPGAMLSGCTEQRKFPDFWSHLSEYLGIAESLEILSLAIPVMKSDTSILGYGI